ncbi:substrate-binding domain-containing protein [Erythrobacter sp. THAF29]|uniref:substrate-binding domain-containing protein n=1 Tax=Erythrobacter sp. THAF29 TaxID=2587851 RepID=UPI0012A827F4|nr:substrate-binding domain-containing protein [Erythrobacter sp. THAF29]QFT77316.1 Catabolite control protein A [Erythrobacter sp. THAF29]
MVNGGELLLLFDNVGAEYVSRISDGAKAASAASGFKTRSTNLYGRDEDVSDYLTDDAIAGVIVTPPISDDRPVLGKIEALGLPVVRIAPMLDLERGNIVTMDEYDAARAIAEHLLKHGHRRIGFIKGPRRHLVSIRRFNGFANALGGHGLKVDHDLIVEGDFSRASGREVADALLRAKPSAVFASNDEMAIGFMEAARERGVDIPGDISLVGFDGNSAASRCNPALTTIRQPLREMGETAVRILAESLSRPGSRRASVEVPYDMLEGASVREFAA